MAGWLCRVRCAGPTAKRGLEGDREAGAAVRQRVEEAGGEAGAEEAGAGRAAPVAPRVFTDMDNLLGEYYRTYRGGSPGPSAVAARLAGRFRGLGFGAQSWDRPSTGWLLAATPSPTPHHPTPPHPPPHPPPPNTPSNPHIRTDTHPPSSLRKRTHPTPQRPPYFPRLLLGLKRETGDGRDNHRPEWLLRVRADSSESLVVGCGCAAVWLVLPCTHR
jgi:hypothetical protein